ncbi:cupin domain-containing protein [Amycolatopsis plumensis]|uniref:Cupin domain-containing protein n=1 Tax=Amycolatopsis plumensis TaxID=236508 RepID=A0ABV5U5W3_9PSEU
MTVRITRGADAPRYHPPRHSGVDARRLQGHEAGPTQRFWVGESRYQPGAVAERSATTEETVYVVLDGELRLILEDGSAQALASGDSVHLPRGTTRSVENTSGRDARLLVIIATPSRTES